MTNSTDNTPSQNLKPLAGTEPLTIDTTKLPDLPLEDGVFFIDNSFLEWLTTCPRGCEYNRLRKRIPAADRPSLNFGTAIHAALEHRYRYHQANIPDLELEKAQAQILEECFRQKPPPEDDFRNLNWAIEVNHKYNEHTSFEPFNLLLDNEGKPLVELSFALPLYVYEASPTKRIQIYYTGRIDLPTMWDGQIIVGDHKTTSILGTTFFDDLRVSPQQVGYCWAFQKLTGKKVSGFFINAIRVRPAPAKPKGGFEAWWAESFQRHKEYLLPHTLEEWHTNVIALIDEFFWHYSRQFFPQKKKWCCGKYGRCQYYDVCDTPPNHRGLMLSSTLFTDNIWSPLKDPSQPKQVS